MFSWLLPQLFLFSLHSVETSIFSSTVLVCMVSLCHFLLLLLPLSPLFFFPSLLHSLLFKLACMQFLLYPKFLLAFFFFLAQHVLAYYSLSFNFKCLYFFNFRIYLTVNDPAKGERVPSAALWEEGRTIFNQGLLGEAGKKSFH